MRKTKKSPGEKMVEDIKRTTRKHYSSEEKIRIVLDWHGGGLVIDHHNTGNWDSYQLRQSSDQTIRAKQRLRPKVCTTRIKRVKFS